MPCACPLLVLSTLHAGFSSRGEIKLTYILQVPSVLSVESGTTYMYIIIYMYMYTYCGGGYN